MAKKRCRFFQVFNHSNREWEKFDKEQGRVVKIQKYRFAGIPQYNEGENE